MSLFSLGRSDPRWLVLILVLSALVSAGVALAAWFLLPLLALGGNRPFESEASRLVAILLIVLVWGAGNAVLRARRNSADQARLDALDRQEFEARAQVSAADAALEAEFAEMRAAARYAFRRVRGRRLGDLLVGRGRTLPRFLVLGPTGSGKTTILASANLSLPFDPRENETSAAPPCRFVVSERAVFVDVAGHLALASDEARESLWPRLLDLLRSLRRWSPIQGILLVVAAPDFAAIEDEDRGELARALRRCLEEATLHLRVRVPVYLLMSKLDRLPGFSEFFEPLGADERAQVWGMPLAPAEHTATTGPDRGFGESFDDLVRRASTRQIGFLHAEPDETRRSLALEFPAQLAGYKAPLGVLLDELVRPNGFEAAPMLRGIFMSSALQDGTAVDTLGNLLARNFAIAAADEGRSGRQLRTRVRGDRVRRRPYFLKRLFSDVILSDIGAEVPTEGALRRNVVVGAGVSVLAAIVLTAGVILFWSSYRKVERYMGDVVAASDLYRDDLDKIATSSDINANALRLTALDALARLDIAAAAPVPSSFDIVEPLRSDVVAVHRQGFNDLLMPQTMRSLEAILTDPATRAFEVYQGLKLYLLLGRGQNPDPALVTELSPRIADGFAGLGRDATLRQQIADHIVSLATVPLVPQDLDQDLVKRVRRRLDGVAVAQIGYELVKRAPALAALKPWRPLDHAGSLGSKAIARSSGKLLSSGVASMFTVAEIGTVGTTAATTAASLTGDTWVFAADAERPTLASRALEAGILDLYRTDYVRTWDTFLSDLSVPVLPSASAGADVIAIISGPDSPIVQLLGAVAIETDPSRHLEDKIPQGLASKAPGLSLVQAALSRPDVAPPTNAVRTAVSNHFSGLRNALTRPKDGQGSEIDVILKSLDPLYRQLLLIGSGAPSEAPAPSAGFALAAAAIKKLPPAIQPYFTELLGDANGLLKVNMRGRAAQSWAESGQPACETATAKAFPFDLSAVADVPLGEFTRLFSPNGLIADFRRTQLAALVDTSARPWRWRDGHAAPSDPPDPTLAMFERADAITAAFFSEGDHLGVRFIATPVRADNKITRFQLDIGGASLVYAHGPIVPFNGQWPPPIADAPSTLSVQPEVDGRVNSLVGSGPWGLFRLLAQARPVHVADGMQFGYDMSGRQLSFRLATPTLHNAFDLNVTGSFTCPRF